MFEQAQSLLTALGHSVTIVSGDELDTAGEIGTFDVVVLTGTGLNATGKGFVTSWRSQSGYKRLSLGRFTVHRVGVAHTAG